MRYKSRVPPSGAACGKRQVPQGRLRNQCSAANRSANSRAEKIYKMKKVLLFISLIIVLFIGFVGTYLMFNGPRMKNQPSIKNYQAQMFLPGPNSIALNEQKKSGQIVPISMNKKNIKIGQYAYNYYCTFCHGDKGNGEGPVGKSYTPVPSNLSNTKIQNYSDDELVKAILNGKGHEPVLSNIINDEYLPYLVLYVRSFANQSKQLLTNNFQVYNQFH
jgi:mono/diheme cytochrome c family protein